MGVSHIATKVVIGTEVGIYLTQKAFDSLGLKFSTEDGVFYWGPYPPLVKLPRTSFYNKNRAHPMLVKMATLLGEEAGPGIKVINIPEGLAWHVLESYLGGEYIVEQHKSWE